jgi:hypothetical protein
MVAAVTRAAASAAAPKELELAAPEGDPIPKEEGNVLHLSPHRALFVFEHNNPIRSLPESFGRVLECPLERTPLLIQTVYRILPSLRVDLHLLLHRNLHLSVLHIRLRRNAFQFLRVALPLGGILHFQCISFMCC